jgi:hypothetical protein
VAACRRWHDRGHGVRAVAVRIPRHGWPGPCPVGSLRRPPWPGCPSPRLEVFPYDLVFFDSVPLDGALAARLIEHESSNSDDGSAGLSRCLPHDPACVARGATTHHRHAEHGSSRGRRCASYGTPTLDIAVPCGPRDRASLRSRPGPRDDHQCCWWAPRLGRWSIAGQGWRLSRPSGGP